jgi:Vacuolar membrane-associated protein Iml1
MEQTVAPAAPPDPTVVEQSSPPSSRLLRPDGTPDEVGKVFSLHVHDFSFNTSELVINPEAFPDVQASDFLEIYRPHSRKDRRLVLQIDSVGPIKGGRLQISLLKSVAEIFELQPWSDVLVRKVDPKAAAADFVEFTIKDQFIPRADILRFKRTVFGSPAYRGKVFNLLGMRASVRELTRHGRPAVSGVLTERTNFIFRSRSSRFFWLVQVSIEMYEYAPNGQLYLEIFISDFVTTLLQKWKALQATHSLTVVFFSRTFFIYKVDKGLTESGLDCRAVRFASDGRAYEVSHSLYLLLLLYCCCKAYR